MNRRFLPHFFGVISTPVLQLKNKGLKLPKKGVTGTLYSILES